MYHHLHIYLLPIKLIHSLHWVSYHFIALNWVIISPGTITARTSARQICCQPPCHFYVWTASCHWDRAEIKNWERVERKRCGSCGRPNRSMWDKRMSNKPMMNPEWSLLWGPGLLLTNVLLTSRKQPVIEIHSVSARGGRVWRMRHERLLQRVKVSIMQSCLNPRAYDEQDIIDTQQCDSLSIRRIIKTIQPTYCMDMVTEICMRKAPNKQKCK